MPKDSQPTGVVKCHLCHSRGRPEWRKTQSGTQRTLSPSTRQGTQQWVAWCSAQIVSTTYHVSAIFCHTSPFVVTLAPHKGNYAGVQWNGMTLIFIQITLLPFIILSGKCWRRGLQNHPMAIYHESKRQVRTYHPVTTNKGGGRRFQVLPGGWSGSVTQSSKHRHCECSGTISGLSVDWEEPSENLSELSYIFFL